MSATYRAALIGHTGRGDYGHQLDTAYRDLPQVEVVAVADPDSEGGKAAAERAGAAQVYSDYRQMLAAEKPDLVNVCPRLAGDHTEMVIAAAEAGARGIFCEKPLAPSLRQADEILASCQRHNVKVAVAHRRANPYEQYGKKLVDAGEIGQVQVIRAHGKWDRRAGGQDLMVLGTHMMDSMRYYAGSEIDWAHGHVAQDGREVGPEDSREGDEEIGLIAGNFAVGYFVFKNGITAHFESMPGDTQEGRNSLWFGFEVHGTEGILSMRNSPAGVAHIYRHGMWIPGDEHGRWERIRLDEWEQVAERDRTQESNRLIVEELIQAIEEDRDVVEASSGADARAALEMIMAIHESQRLGGRVSFPLENRDNPYQVWRDEAGV